MDVGALVIPHAQPAKLIEPANVRSTTHRHPPRPLPYSVRRMASKGTICRARSPRRIAAASYPRSPSTQVRALPGRPRSPRSRGIASNNARVLASRSDSHRLGEPRAAHPTRRRSDGACSRVWPGRWHWDRSASSPTRTRGPAGASARECRCVPASGESMPLDRCARSRASPGRPRVWPGCSESHTLSLSGFIELLKQVALANVRPACPFSTRQPPLHTINPYGIY
jgi:hypothetical protein